MTLRVTTITHSSVWSHRNKAAWSYQKRFLIQSEPEMVPGLGEIHLLQRSLQSPDLQTLTVAVFFFSLDWSQVDLAHFGPAAPDLVKVDVLLAFQLWSRHSDVIGSCTFWKVFSNVAALGELSSPRSMCTLPYVLFLLLSSGQVYWLLSQGDTNILRSTRNRREMVIFSHLYLKQTGMAFDGGAKSNSVKALLASICFLQ